MFLTTAALSLFLQSIVSLSGTVSDAESNLALSGACIEVRPDPVVACTDAAGHYSARIAPGNHEIRVRRAGYSAQLVEIRVGLDSAMHFDFALALLPLALQPIRVTTRLTGSAAHDSRDASTEVEAGAWHATTDQLRRYSLQTGSDILREAALAAGIAAGPEAPTTLHVRGGAGDQNVVVLDGVPLFNATHIGGVLSAINPDIVGHVTLHAGAPNAQFGDALSSVIEVQTDAPTVGRPLFRGAIDGITTRQSVVGPLFDGRGSYAMAGRWASRHLVELAYSKSNTIADLGDFFAKTTAPLAGGTLELFAFSSQDRLGFDALPISDTKATSADTATTLAALPVATSDRNTFRWTSSTGALIWTRHAEAATDIRFRLWRTIFKGGVAWTPANNRLSLQSSFHESGLAADASRRTVAGRLSAGFSLQARDARYHVVHLASSNADSSQSPYVSALRAPLVALYAEEQLGEGRRWTLTTGLRAGFSNGGIPWIDPRLSLRYGLSSRFSLLAGFAQMHQSVQSLRNEESLVDALVGADLPTMANASNVALGQATQVGMGAVWRIDERTTVRLETYARRMDHLLLVHPTTAQPFAVARATAGSGRASGLTAQVEHVAARVSARAGYAFSQSERLAVGTRYRPSFGADHSVSASLALHLDLHSELQAAFHGLVGRSGRISAGDVEWPSGGPLGGFVDVGGAPQTLPGASNVARLPAFARFDLGAQHSWRVPGLGRDGRLTLSAAVVNVFAHTNVLAVTQPAGATTRHLLPMLSRGLRLSVDWAF